MASSLLAMEAERVENLSRKASGLLERSRSAGHKHGRRCFRLICSLIGPGEETLVECKQSKLQSLSPARIIATTRRIVIVKPSFWGLYLGKDLFSSTEYNIIPYRHLTSVDLSRGRVLTTVQMNMENPDKGSGLVQEGRMEGIDSENAAKLVDFLGAVIERKEGDGGLEGSKIVKRGQVILGISEALAR